MVVCESSQEEAGVDENAGGNTASAACVVKGWQTECL